MPHRVLTYRGPNRADGYPASDQTDEDLALLARERGLSVPKLVDGFLAFHYPDGTPLYPRTARGEDDGPRVAVSMAAAAAPPKRKG